MPGAIGIDLGAGCGIVALVLTLKDKVKTMVAIELQRSLGDFARRNTVLNGLNSRIEVIRGDIRKVEELFPPKSFGLAVSNPPYRAAGRGRVSPSSEKSIARHEQQCSLDDLIRAAAYLLKPEGVLAFCQLRERWQEIAEALERHGLEVVRREDAGAMALVEAAHRPGHRGDL
jgi:tRNA1Val (adenine37-N6)-methyltransferase